MRPLPFGLAQISPPEASAAGAEAGQGGGGWQRTFFAAPIDSPGGNQKKVAVTSFRGKP